MVKNKRKNHPEVPLVFLPSGPVVLRVWSVDSWGVYNVFQRGFKVRLILTITLSCFLPFSDVDICRDGAKAIVGKTAGSWAYTGLAVVKMST